MKFKDLFNRPAHTAGSAPERNAEPVPPWDARSPAPGVAGPVSVEEALRQLKSIQELFGEEEDDVLTMPCSALLRNLPERLRGAQWQAASFPDVNLELPRDATLKQLRKGRISYPLGDFLPVLPEGWVQDDPAATVDFDLATVVQAIPPAWFRTSAAVSRQVEAARHIPDYFKPVQPADAMAPPTAMPDLRPLRPGEWPGREPAQGLGALTVDINRATERELLRLPGIGPRRAQAIIQYRQDPGRYASIFDLANAPGIGRKSFRNVTGLTFRRKNRHEVLSGLLGSPPETRPTLLQLTEQIRTTLAARGCLLGNEAGQALAASGLPDDEAARHAALVPQLFRRARRCLDALDPAPVRCLALPAADAPRLLYRTGAYFLIIFLPAGGGWDAAIAAGRDIAREVHWLLGGRAVVRE